MKIYEIREGRDVRYLDASICDGKLRLSGQDIGPTVEKFFGENEYEFWYDFSVDDTNRLKLLFHTDDLLVALKEYFDNQDCLESFCLLCKESGIDYSTFSWF